MNNREQFYAYKKEGLLKHLTANDRVKNLVTLLLDSLVIPDKALIFRLDENRLSAFGIDKSEPINFASLRCIAVEEKDGGIFEVTIEEAAPDECLSLCSYIEEYMTAWGWIVNVKTEW